VVTAIGDVVGDAVDHHGLAALPDLVANGGFEFQFTAGGEAERDPVAHGEEANDARRSDRNSNPAATSALFLPTSRCRIRWTG
jgi:hypothetical protein